MGVLVRENLTTNGDSVQLLSLFDRVLQQPQEQTGLLALKVGYMMEKKMPKEEVSPVLRQILEIDPENEMARQNLLTYAIEENDTLNIVNISLKLCLHAKRCQHHDTHQKRKNFFHKP